MQIKRIRIQDFRSIKTLDLPVDAPYLVLEGTNDTGKSNIMHAIDLALRHASLGFWGNPPFPYPLWPERFTGRQESIFRSGTTTTVVDLELAFSTNESARLRGVQHLGIEVTWKVDRGLVSSSLAFRLNDSTRDLNGDEPVLADLLFWSLRLVDAYRKPREEAINPSSNARPDALPFWQGDNLKSLLYSFKNHSIPEVQANFDELTRRCKDPDFPVGELFVGVVGGGNRLFARTRQNGLVLDLEDRSDGVQQLVFLLALSVCHTGSIVAIEEPEAHLNVDLQKKFWSKLKELVGHGIDQVFVTSHSPVFELESSRVVVSRGEDGFTKAEHAPKVALAPHDYDALQVRRDGSLELPPLLRERLGVTGEGGTLFADSTNGVVRLLTPGAWTKETLEDAK